ncbi:hypothetical protein ACI3EY_17210 [Ornithinimicrobium sp. LYQ92]|uniref:hypothetical protein n=1 Tax=Serinicoccus sp. LYQ92 TaxID=3378798 RepID=UPI003852F480
MTYSRDEGIAALEPLLSGRGFADGFRLIAVRPESAHLLVLFRWRRNRHVFGVVIPWSPGVGLSTGEPVASAEQWAIEVSWWLAEELDTGYVGRAQRRQRTGYIELHGPEYEHDRRYSVSRVFGDGAWLAHFGWDVRLPRELAERGMLITWLRASVRNARGEPVVGQAVVSRHANGDAQLAALDIATGTPEAVSRDLAWVCVHQAGDDGAERIQVSRAQARLLTGMGFRPVSADGVWLDTNPLNIHT